MDHKWKYYDYLRPIPAIIFAGIIFYFSSLSDPYPVRPEPPRILELEIAINDILHVSGISITFSFNSFWIFW